MLKGFNNAFAKCVSKFTKIYATCNLRVTILNAVRFPHFYILSTYTSLLLSHCWAKASSHTEKVWALITTLAQDGLITITIICPSFLTMFSFTDVSDVQDKFRKYICIEKDTLVLARIWTRNLVHERRGNLWATTTYYDTRRVRD